MASEKFPTGYPQVLLLREAAEILHLHPNTLRKWSSKGLVPCFRIGTRGDRRFLREDIAMFTRKSV